MADRDDAIWAVRAFVYGFVVAHGRPPTADEAAAGLEIDGAAARAAYRRLDGRHGVLLEPGGEAIRMAKPFSGVPTPFRVRANGRAYWANCALDALGIPAALGTDAEIEATLADDGTPARPGSRSRAGGCGVGARSSTCCGRSASGTTTRSRPERRSCSSGRKGASTLGAGGAGGPGAWCSRSTRPGRWRGPGTGTAWRPGSAVGAGRRPRRSCAGSVSLPRSGRRTIAEGVASLPRPRGGDGGRIAGADGGSDGGAGGPGERPVRRRGWWSPCGRWAMGDGRRRDGRGGRRRCRCSERRVIAWGGPHLRPLSRARERERGAWGRGLRGHESLTRRSG